MKLATGDLWSNTDDLTLVTGNSTLRRDGALVMGRGAAAEALDRYPGCNFVFGDLIRAAGSNYGIVWHPTLPILCRFAPALLGRRTREAGEHEPLRGSLEASERAQRTS